MFLNAQGGLADQVGGNLRHALLLAAVELVPGDPVDARVRINPDVDDADPGLHPARRPGRVEGLRERDVHLAGTNAGDLHAGSSRHAWEGWRSSGAGIQLDWPISLPSP